MDKAALTDLAKKADISVESLMHAESVDFVATAVVGALERVWIADAVEVILGIIIISEIIVVIAIVHEWDFDVADLKEGETGSRVGFCVACQSVQVVVGDDEVVALAVPLEVAERVGQVSV